MREEEAGEGVCCQTALVQNGGTFDGWPQASELKPQSERQEKAGLLAVQAVKREREVSDGGRAAGGGIGGAANVPMLILAVNRREFSSQQG